MEIDSAELQGKSFVCLEGCAMCCLCQPELSMDEVARFRKYGLTAGLTREHIQGHMTDEPTAIKLQGGTGACHFLRADRRCSIHDLRPSSCRQFPVHLHSLARIQLNANLSCRGITEGGNTLMNFGEGLLGDAGEKVMNGILRETIESVSAFENNARNAGVHQSPDRLGEAAAALMPFLSNPEGFGKILAFADSEPKLGGMPVEDIVGMVEATDAPDDLAEMANAGNLEQLDLDNPAWYPIYVDEKFRWRTYRTTGGSIEVMEIEPDGTSHLEMTIKALELAMPDDGAGKVFSNYARLLNSRDHFLGYAYWLCDDHEYRNDLMTVYLGLMATTMMDLWWRSCLIGRVIGKEKLDAGLAMEGVRAFDMDCLDMPTLGTFF
ncbi:MAG: YkgJ family cysteine cluster protein [Thermoplasmata archaeon]